MAVICQLLTNIAIIWQAAESAKSGERNGDDEYLSADPMKDWVQSRIEDGKYASSSDYVRDLIRKDQQQQDKLVALQAAITLGIESGGAGELDIESMKRKAKQLAGLEVQ